MAPTTQKMRPLLQASLLLALLIATAGIGHSQTASLCLSSQLSAHHEGADQSMGGHISEYFSFRNDSKSPCTLKGAPAVAFFDGAGRRMNIKAEKDKDTSNQPVTLDPGGKAFFGFDYTSCGVQNGAVVRKSRCPSSTRLGFTPPGTTGMLMIRESIDPNGSVTRVSSFVPTLKELGFENSDVSKPEPKPYSGNGKRLTFNKGAESMTVKGSLNGENDSASYLLDVKAHQRIGVASCGGILLTASNIYDPAGKEVSDDRDLDGNNGVTETAAAGTYRIEVLVNRNSGEKKGSFCIEVAVTSIPR